MQELREFKCIECGHMVIVNPSLSADYTPTVCMQCWNDVVVPRHRADDFKMLLKAQELLALLKPG
jgi:DNA-directed RNA polymerase subunit RPC12/RpoP